MKALKKRSDIGQCETKIKHFLTKQKTSGHSVRREKFETKLNV